MNTTTLNRDGKHDENYQYVFVVLIITQLTQYKLPALSYYDTNTTINRSTVVLLIL